MVRCAICGKPIYGQDYPGEGAVCNSCQDDIAYEEYCELQQMEGV